MIEIYTINNNSVLKHAIELAQEGEDVMVESRDGHVVSIITTNKHRASKIKDDQVSALMEKISVADFFLHIKYINYSFDWSKVKSIDIASSGLKVTLSIKKRGPYRKLFSVKNEKEWGKVIVSYENDYIYYHCLDEIVDLAILIEEKIESGESIDSLFDQLIKPKNFEEKMYLDKVLSKTWKYGNELYDFIAEELRKEGFLRGHPGAIFETCRV